MTGVEERKRYSELKKRKYPTKIHPVIGVKPTGLCLLANFSVMRKPFKLLKL